MPLDPKQVQDVFLEVVELPDSAERAAALDRLCGGDAELRRRVETLLRAHDQPDTLLHASSGDPAATTEPRPVQQPGAIIAGRYKLLEQIGEGGMGAVWVAEQSEPVRRRVAIKLIKPGMDSRQVLSRFEAERQALAVMDHPNIAKVYDGGMTSEGRPFFVMEYVRGVPLTQYCDDARLTVARRLALFTQVCQAVQHAHQKGIIHRDLKPSNILVCLYDGQPVPKVIDFGLAKAIHQPLTDNTLYTAHGLMVGTPLYMSPEQAEFNNLDVDTRTDIFSLGVILYELLTGTTPLEKAQFKDAAFNEILRLIKEEEPPRPSLKLSTLSKIDVRAHSSLASIAALRGVEPAQLSRIVKGDLDWIVMKSVEKERSRRYATAGDLARDIERYLHDEPVEACPPSAGYRLKKFSRKHRAALVTAAAFGLLLLAGIAISTWQAVRATIAEGHAKDQSVAATEARDRESKARRKAEKAGAEARQARAREETARRSAEADRDAKQEALVRADGLRISAEAAAARHSDPGLALLLAIEGVQRVPNHLTYATLYDALASSRQRRTIAGPLIEIQFARLGPSGQSLVAAGDLRGEDAASPLPGGACVFDPLTSRLRALWPGYRCTLGDFDLSPDGKRAAAAIEGSAWVRYAAASRPRHVFTDRVAYLWDPETGRDTIHLRGHKDRVTSVRFSPDDTKVLTASWDGTVRVWDAATGQELHVMAGHQCALAAARFNADGTRAISLTTNGLRQTEYPAPQSAADGESALELDPGVQDLAGAAFDGRTPSVQSSSFAGEASFGRIWNVVSGELVAELQKARPGLFTFGTVWHPTAANFSPDGSQVAVAFSEGVAAIWDATGGGQEKLLLAGHEGEVFDIAYEPGGQRLATAGSDRTARLWDTATGQELLRLRGHQDAVRSVRFSSDGKLLLTTSLDRTARVWDTRTGEEVANLQGHTNVVAWADFLANQIVTAGDSTVRAWDSGKPDELGTILSGGPGELTALEFSPDSGRLLTATDDADGQADEMARIWDVASGKQVLTLGQGRFLGAIRSAQFLAGGTQVLTASTTSKATVNGAVINGSAVHVWDARSGDDLRPDLNNGTGATVAVASRDSRWIASVTDGYQRVCGRGLVTTNFQSGGSAEAGIVRIWNAADGRAISQLPTEVSDDCVPQFSPTGDRVLVSAQYEGPARVHDVQTGRELFSLSPQLQSPIAAMYSPSGKTIAVSTRDRRIALYNAEDGRPLAAAIDGLPRDATRLVFAADSGRMVAICGAVAVVCDLAQAKIVTELKGHEKPIRSLAITRDGQYVLTGSDDQTAVLWDAGSGRILAIYRGHTAPVHRVVMSPDGQYVATGDKLGSVRLWPRDLWPAIHRRKPREFTAAERERFEIPQAAIN
jgi:WD40 repeat protein/serine/threonine protein kinase